MNLLPRLVVGEWRTSGTCSSSPPGQWRYPPEVVLDLSRLLSRVRHPSPTGIDRVEMAYARTLSRLIPDRLRFAAVHPTGVYGRLPSRSVEEFLNRTEERWESTGGAERRMQGQLAAVNHCWLLRPRPVPDGTAQRVLLQVSPHHLQHSAIIARKLRRECARFVCMVHDLIPITHPEYARPTGSDLHERRMRSVETFADGILANSQATLDVFLQRPEAHSSGRPARVARLGVDPTWLRPTPSRAPNRSYFVCLSTIEPRKNHLLLLHIWRSMIEALGAEQVPTLYLVGRRGWENENVVDMLDRCQTLRGCVRELPRLPDSQLRDLLAGARALLMPSFAEGFGMPISEALAARVPVIASDIPAHREAGGPAPDYIDPIDGTAWRQAILDYSAPASARRAAQKTRLCHWHPVTWDAHVKTALSLVEEVAAC
ncbi:MAG: glycosyltransferase family 4 protein [Sphingobium sp.]|nr:glycosyltransferase family 4 protein [Sphingobium sp.]